MITNTMFRVLFVCYLSLFFSQNDAAPFCGESHRVRFGDLARSSSRAAEYIRVKLMDNKSLRGHHLGVTLHSLRLSGYSLKTLSTLKQRFEEQVRQVKASAITPAEAGYYLYGSLAVCQDPKDYAHLVKRIKEGIPSYPTLVAGRPFNHPFQYGLAVLALCMSGNGQKLYPGYAVSLKHLIGRSGGLLHAGDTLGLLTMALACIAKDDTLKDDISIQQTLGRSAKAFIGAQKSDGSFGNSITTAIAVQTLLTLRESALNIDTKKWRCMKTVEFFLAKQSNDGSFETPYVMSVTQTLPALIGAIPGDVKYLKCPAKPDSRKPTKIKVCVRLEFHTTLRDGSRPSPPAPVTLEVNNGTNAHEILRLAAQINPCYNITATLGAYGHSVDSICRIYKDRVQKKYWMIYTGPMIISGSMKVKSAGTGIDSFRPKHNTCVIFKYRKLNFR